MGRAWVSNKLMEIETEGGRGPGKGGERPRSPTWSEGSPGCGCRAALEEDAYSRIKLVLRWYLSGFYKKPKVRAPSGEAWGSASGRSTQPRPRHPPLPAVGGEGHSPPQDCPRRSSEMGGRAQGPAGGARPTGSSRSLKGPSWALHTSEKQLPHSNAKKRTLDSEPQGTLGTQGFWA